MTILDDIKRVEPKHVLSTVSIFVAAVAPGFLLIQLYKPELVAPLVTKHLKNIFETGELEEKAVSRDFRHTAEDGKDYTTRFYNLDANIAVGFRALAKLGG